MEALLRRDGSMEFGCLMRVLHRNRVFSPIPLID